MEILFDHYQTFRRKKGHSHVLHLDHRLCALYKLKYICVDSKTQTNQNFGVGQSRSDGSFAMQGRLHQSPTLLVRDDQVSMDPLCCRQYK